jgi:hypothetical protein
MDASIPQPGDLLRCVSATAQCRPQNALVIAGENVFVTSVLRQLWCLVPFPTACNPRCLVAWK